MSWQGMPSKGGAFDDSGTSHQQARGSPWHGGTFTDSSSKLNQLNNVDTNPRLNSTLSVSAGKRYTLCALEAGNSVTCSRARKDPNGIKEST